jgi:hypothetical protein
MLASRLLGLGKEKAGYGNDTAWCDLSPEEFEELVSIDDPHPLDHDLAATVRRYLGVKMEKAHTKLGGSDWSRADLSPAHFTYMAEDVSHLPGLWSALESALREAQLEAPFRERMRFFSHLNEIKMPDPCLLTAQNNSRNVLRNDESLQRLLRFQRHRPPNCPDRGTEFGWRESPS